MVPERLTPQIKYHGEPSSPLEHLVTPSDEFEKTASALVGPPMSLPDCVTVNSQGKRLNWILVHFVLECYGT